MCGGRGGAEREVHETREGHCEGIDRRPRAARVVPCAVALVEALEQRLAVAVGSRVLGGGADNWVRGGRGRGAVGGAGAWDWRWDSR